MPHPTDPDRSRSPRRRRTLAAPAAALGIALAASGCGVGPGDDVVELTMWAWAPGIEEVVDLFNEAHPDIRVEVDSQAQGDNLVTKLLTADWAGAGPDVAQVEYQALPSLVVSGVVADLTEEVEPVRGDFSDATWQSVTFDGAVYAVPQDTAPMMMFYREDLLAELGVTELPATWEEFAALAGQVRSDDPQRWLTTFSASDPGWFAGLARQAGAQWWDVGPDGWGVSVDDEATRRVADYWGGLVTSGAVAGQPMYTPEWNAWLNDGTLLAWPGAVWGPAVLEGIAPDTAGSWVAAPLPQWDAASPATGSWGGSTTAVVDETDHPAEAAELARWINTDPAAVEAMITVGNVYPATTTAAGTPALSAPPAFMPNQPDFYDVVAEVAATTQPFTWGPVTNETYASYGDAFSLAVRGRSGFDEAVASMQEATLGTMRRQGYTLTGQPGAAGAQS